MSTSKKVHEKYHSVTKEQRKIIRDNNFTYRILLNIINQIVEDENKKILDIGCGAGTLSLYVASKGHEVLGIDISSRAIKECLSSKKELGLKNVDFKQIDFPDNYPNKKFDVIIFTEVIEHLKNGEKALDRIHKMLNPNGIIILSTPLDSAPLHKMGLTKEFDIKVGHVRRYSLNKIRSMVKEGGFKIVETQKTEGVLRNFLFVNPVAGKSIRFIKYFISDLVTLIDNSTIPIFGASNIVIVAKKQ